MQVRKIIRWAFCLVTLLPAFAFGYVAVISTEDGERTTLSDYMDQLEDDPNYAPFIMTVYAIILATIALAVALFK